MAKGNSKISGGGGAGGGSGVSIGGAGGGANAGAPLPQPTNFVTPPTPQQVAQGNVLPTGGVAFDKFQQMTDDEKADVVTDALNTGVPVFLDDSGIQRLAYFTGLSDKPKIVSDDQLDKIQGQDLFRTVHDAYNKKTDIGYTANDICKQVRDGDFTMYSDSGGSAHGKAIYFADSFTGSRSYMDTRKNNLMMRAKITSGKTISESTLHSNFSKARSRGDKLALACRGDANLYALAKGYSAVIDTGWSKYHMVLNRGCLTMSSTTKDPMNLNKWK